LSVVCCHVDVSATDRFLVQSTLLRVIRCDNNLLHLQQIGRRVQTKEINLAECQ
jgi:hypothetical protein